MIASSADSVSNRSATRKLLVQGGHGAEEVPTEHLFRRGPGEVALGGVVEADRPIQTTPDYAERRDIERVFRGRFEHVQQADLIGNPF